MVRTRSQKWLRRGLFAGQLLALAGVLGTVFRLVWPVPADQLSATARIRVDAAPSATEPMRDELHPLDWYAPIWTRDLRQPPIPPPQPTSAPAPPPPPPQLPALTATFVELGAGWAQLKSTDGKLVVIRLHDRFGAFELAAVEPRRAALRHADEVYWLYLPDSQVNGTVREQR